MAIPTSNLNFNTSTFGSLTTAVNGLLYDLNSLIVTTAANSSGGSTSGNAAIIGIFGANTFAVGNNITGGIIGTSANLVVSSNLVSNGTISVFNSNVYVTSANTWIAANVITIAGNTLTITANATLSSPVIFSANVSHTANVTFSSGQFNSSSNVNFTGANTTIGGTNLNVTANSSFVNVNLNGNILITGLLSISNTFSTSSNTNLANTTITGYLTPNGVASSVGTSGARWTIFGQVIDTANVNANNVIANTLSVTTIQDIYSASNTNLGSNVSSPQPILSIPIASYRSGEVRVSTGDLNGNFQIDTLMFIQATGNVYYTTTGSVYSNTPLCTLSANANTTFVTVSVTQNYDNLSAKMVAMVFKT